MSQPTDSSKRFPILEEGRPSVSWLELVPHARQAYLNHNQTLERLAQRGGLSYAEFWFVMHDEDWDDWKMEHAQKAGRELVERLNRNEHAE
jgi:hypothetical protein